jgi:hypothetical protein
VPEMTRLIGAVPEWVDGAAVPAGILASGQRIRHRKAAPVAGQWGSGAEGHRGGLRTLRANEEARLGSTLPRCPADPLPTSSQANTPRSEKDW